MIFQVNVLEHNDIFKNNKTSKMYCNMNKYKKL
jgi:hypothetical protein